MPFKSEKQRKYLGANEPEIARDWTDTYGSKIHKADGGIMRRRYFSGAYGQGAGDRGGNPHASAAENRAAGSGAANERAHAPSNQGEHSRFKADSGYYGHTGGVNPHAGWQKDVKNIEAARSVRPYHHLISDKATQYLPNWMRKNPNFNARTKFLKKEGILKEIGPGKWDTEDEDLSWVHDPNILTSQWGEDRLRELGYVPNSDLHGKEEGGGGEGLPYIWPPVYTAAESAPGEEIASTSGLGSGHFRVPLPYVQNQTRAAQGGRIGLATGGIGDAMAARMVGRGFGHQDPTADSFKPRRREDDVMTRFQMEDIQTPRGNVEEESIEEKRFAGPDWYLQRVEHLMFLGYSYEEAGNIAYNTDAYLDAIGSDFNSGGRVGYGLGSIVKSIFKAPKKALKSVKKLAKSPLGKLALGYLATAGIGNIMQPGAAKWTNMIGKKGWLRPGQVMSNYGNLFSSPTTQKEAVTKAITGNPVKTSYGSILTGKDALKATEATKKVKDAFSYKDALKWIVPGSILAGATAQETDEIGGIDEQYGKDKKWWDAYYANLPAEGDFRVEDEYILSAKGGRVAKNQGGLMNLGGLEKDYRNTGGFVDIGGKEKADDVPARLSRNEFVMTADAVRGAGGGDIDKGAALMDRTMKNLEAKGKGAKDMYQTATRLSEVI